MRRPFLLSAIVALASLPLLGAEKPSTPRTPPDVLRQNVAKIHALETTPVTRASQKERTKLFQWLAEAPDVEMTWCAGVLIDAPPTDKEIQGALLIQAILSAAAFVVENPDKAQDDLLVARAGLQGALRTYRTTVVADPARSSAFFTQLAKSEEAGTIDEYLQPKLAVCRSSPAAGS